MVWKFNGLGHIFFLTVTILLLIQLTQCKCQVLTKSSDEVINYCYQIYGSQSRVYFTNCTSQKCFNYNLNSSCIRIQTQSYDIFQCTQTLCPNQNLYFESCVTKLSKKFFIDNSEIIRFILLVTVLPIGVGIVFIVIWCLICQRYGSQIMTCLLQCLGLKEDRNRVRNYNDYGGQGNDQARVNTRRKYINEEKYHKGQRKYMQNAQSSQYIMSLGSVPISDLKQESCCICLSSQNINCVTSCHHYYHAQCLIQWLQKGTKCPNCQNDQKLFSIMIFCIGCGKIRDCFKFFKKNYVSISKIDIGLFTKWLLCKKCTPQVRQKVHDQSTAAVCISQANSIGWNSRDSHSKLNFKAND